MKLLCWSIYFYQFVPLFTYQDDQQSGHSAESHEQNPDRLVQNQSSLQSKRFMCASLTLKLCAEVWKTGYECSLNPGNENSKLEMETPKFPTKIDFNFHWKSSSLQTETSDFGLDFLFSFLNSTQPTGWIFQSRKACATIDIKRGVS